MRPHKRTLWLGSRGTPTPTPTPTPPPTDYLTPFLADLNAKTERGFWSFTDPTKNFSDAGTTQITNGGALAQTSDLTGLVPMVYSSQSSSKPVWSAAGMALAGGTNLAAPGMRRQTPGTSTRFKTIGAMIKVTDGAGGRTIFGPGSSSSSGFVSAQANRQIGIYIASTYCETNPATPPIVFGNWHTLQVVFDGGSPDLVTVYVDGAVVPFSTGSQGTTGIGGWTALTLGNDGNNSSVPFLGSMKGAYYCEGNLSPAAIARGHLALANL